MSIGWYLGGTVGIGTLLFAFGIGPCVALSLFLVGNRLLIKEGLQHQTFHFFFRSCGFRIAFLNLRDLGV